MMVDRYFVPTGEKVGKLIPKLTIGLNMVFAMFTMFAFGYVGASSIFEETHKRLAAGLFGMIIIMIIEMVLFVIRESKVKTD